MRLSVYSNRLIIWGCTALFMGVFIVGISQFGGYNFSTKYMIENICTEALGVRVTIGELHINQEQGTMRFGHVQVFNPKKFSDGAAIEIENIDVTMEPSSRGRIRLSEVTVTNAQVNLEVQPTKNNLTAISHKMESIKPPVVLSDTEKLKIMIDNITADGNRVRPRSILTTEKRQTVLVPAMKLSQVGYMEQGLPLKDAIRQIWRLLVPEFQKAALDAGFLQGMTAESYEDVEEEIKPGRGGDRLIGE